MGQHRGFQYMSVFVKMEESEQPISTTTTTTTFDMSNPPPLHVPRNHHNPSHIPTASASRQTNPQASSNYRKLDTAGRRQLRAHLRGSAEADNRLMCTYERVVVEDNPVSSTASLQAAENGESVFVRQRRIEFAGEAATQGSTTTTSISTDSEIEISRNGDKLSTQTNISRTSDDSKIDNQQQHDQLRSATDSTYIETDDSNGITKAWNSFEKSWKLQIALTPEEQRNGYRFSNNVDPMYLGFYPRASDKRKFLKAYPIVGPIPDGKIARGCSMPMTIGQWFFIIGLVVMLTGLGLGVYFYVRTQL